jgi:hypothetical protein
MVLLSCDGESKKLILHQTQSNKSWRTNLSTHIIGKAWKIPDVPQFKTYIDLIAFLLKTKNPVQEGNRQDVI